MKSMDRIFRAGRSAGAAACLIAGLLATALTAGCAGGPTPAALPVSGLEPWQVPTEAHGTQRLYRARYDGPDGTGGFALTLRLANPERYQAQAVHSLGKRLWSLDVTGDAGLFLDHRAKLYCALGDDLELSGGPLVPLPLSSFPALLLGRLPEPPAAPPERRAAAPGDDEAAGDEIVFAGADGRRWRARVGEGGRVSGWTLEEEAGRPSVWWRRLPDGEALLSDRERGVQLSWREVVVEPLTEAPAPLEPPADYRPGTCDRIDLAADLVEEDI